MIVIPVSVSALLARIARLSRREFADLRYVLFWKLGARPRASTSVQQAIFARIYAQNEWGQDGESRSGPGSTRSRGESIRQPLIDLFREYGIASLLDAPCGDFNWIPLVTEHLRTYVGVDIVRDMIERNAALFADEKHRFLCRDITRDELPEADAILCRDALVHLSYEDIRATIANFKRSGARYLLATSFAHTRPNVDCRTGGFRPVNLQIAPFGFPDPVARIPDTPHSAPDAGKFLCLWELEGLPAASTAQKSGEWMER